jgi:outer membrane protein assembly factor BamB
MARKDDDANVKPHSCSARLPFARLQERISMPRFATAFAACLFATASFAGTPAMFRGGLAHTGVYAGRAIAAPQIAWTFETKGRVIGSPTVSDGVAYVGSTDGSLYAVDVKSGAALWKFHTDGRVVSTPAVADAKVFFESYDGNFYAVDAKSGAQAWKFAVPGERRFAAAHLHGQLPAGETMPDPFDFYLSSPAAADGAVYFGSGDGNVYALDAASGALKWKFHTGDVVHASPAIANGTLYVGSWDSYLYALDTATGAEKWRFKSGDDPVIHNQVGFQSSPAVMDGVVYAGCRDSNLYAIDAATGAKLWAYNNKGSWVIASPAVKDGRVYAATSDTGKFFALDARSGAELFALNFQRWPMFSSPTIVGDTAYIGSHSGKLYAIDLKTQKVAWAFQTEASKQGLAGYTAPDGGVAYDKAFSENFYDDMIAGVDRLMRLGAILSSPVAADGLVLFGSNDGKLYALKE